MANQVIENPKVFNSNLRKYETTDRGHADVFNANEKVLINNDVYLNQKITDINNQIKTINTNAGLSNTSLDNHKKDTNVHVSLTEKQAWNSKASTALASTTSNGLMSAADKTAITNLSTTINNSITSQKILKALENNSSGLDADLLDGKHASEFATSNHLHNLATTTANGLMSANDKIKLDGFESSASNLENGKSTGSLQMKGCNKDIEDNGIYSFAEGYQTEAISDYSHVEGYQTKAYDSSNRIRIVPLTVSDKNETKEFKLWNHNDLVNLRKLLNKKVMIYSKNSSTSMIEANLISIDGLNITFSENIPVDQNDFLAGTYFTCIVSKENINPNAWYDEYVRYGQPHAEGAYSLVLGSNSHAEGYASVAVGNNSHAEGYGTFSLGEISHAEGCYTFALNNYSHAEGYETFAKDSFSHAEGGHTSALSLYSHAQNYRTTADSMYSTAIGILNKKMSGFDLFVIGNGSETSESSSNTITRTNSNILRVTKSAIYGTGPFNTSGADYAEYFEWQDKNTENEDRVGLFVTFDNEDKIRIANSNDDYILGIISATPTVIGNSYNDQWQGMNVRDDFGRVQYHEVEIPEQKKVIHHEAEYEPVIDEDTKETTQKLIREAYDEEMLICEARKEIQPILNPDFNPNEEFIGREKRKEWAAVGMLGVLKVYDDGTCKVNGYCKVNNEGKATVSDKGYRVIKRIKENIIEVLFR